MKKSPNLNQLVRRFPDISAQALAEWEKLIAGNSNIAGEELSRLGLAYRKTWKRNHWVLTDEGLKYGGS